MKRLIALLISALVILSAYSCAEKTEPVASATESNEIVSDEVNQETERLYPAIPNEKYSDYTFRFLYFDNASINQWAGIPNDVICEEESGEMLSDSVYKRNTIVGEKLGVRFDIMVTGDVAGKLTNSVLSDSDDYDAAMPRFWEIPAMVNGELLANMNSFGSIDYSKPWWDSNSIRDFNIHDFMFGAVSDINFFDKLSTYVVYYNKNMAEDNHLGDINSIVLNGEWSWDKIKAYANGVSNDVNGDGSMGKEDAYGIACQNDAAYIFLHSAGIKLCELDEDKYPVFTFGDEKSISVMQEIYDLMNDTSLFFNRQSYNMTVADAINMFIENRNLFLIRPVQTMTQLREMKADFGIIPVPKYSEDQTDYYSAINPYSAIMICIPRVVSDEERTAVVIDVLSAESYYTVMPAFYDVVLGEKLVRDEESSEMLDIIFNSRMYDIGCIWNFGDYLNTLNTGYKKDVASTLERSRKKIQNGIDSLTELLG